MQKLIFPIRYLSLTITAAPAAKLQGLAPPGWLTPAVALLLLYAALYPPALAWAQELTPIATIAENISDFIVGPFARSVAIIGLAACGFLAFAGRMPWSVAIAVIAGIVLVFGATTIVNEIADIAGAEGGGE